MTETGANTWTGTGFETETGNSSHLSIYLVYRLAYLFVCIYIGLLVYLPAHAHKHFSWNFRLSAIACMHKHCLRRIFLGRDVIAHSALP